MKLDTFPSDLLFEVFKNMQAKDIIPIIGINKYINRYFDNNMSLWEHIYNNTFSSKHLIEWDTSSDYRIQLKVSLANAKKVHWFKRKAFIEYLCDKSHIRVCEGSSCTYAQLKNGFTRYTNGKYRELPHSCWETLYTYSAEKQKVLKNLATYCNYVSNTRGVFLGWLWPNRPTTMITGIRILK